MLYCISMIRLVKHCTVLFSLCEASLADEENSMHTVYEMTSHCDVGKADIPLGVCGCVENTSDVQHNQKTPVYTVQVKPLTCYASV